MAQNTNRKSFGPTGKDSGPVHSNGARPEGQKYNTVDTNVRHERASSSTRHRIVEEHNKKK